MCVALSHHSTLVTPCKMMLHAILWLLGIPVHLFCRSVQPFFTGWLHRGKQQKTFTIMQDRVIGAQWRCPVS